MTSKSLLRAVLVATAVSALSFIAAQPAIGAPPEPVDPQTIDLPANLGCPGFALRLQQSGGNLHSKEFTDRNGNEVKIIQAGKGFTLTYTNLGPDLNKPVTKKSVSLRTNGSVSKTT